MSSEAREFGLSQIGQISVTVYDLDRAVEFYRDTLGVEYQFQVPGMAFFNLSGVRLVLAVPEREEFDHPGSVIYYRVDDVRQAYEILKSRDVRFEAEPHIVARLDTHELWMAFFRDVDGNLLALMGEVPNS